MDRNIDERCENKARIASIWFSIMRKDKTKGSQGLNSMMREETKERIP